MLIAKRFPKITDSFSSLGEKTAIEQMDQFMQQGKATSPLIPPSGVSPPPTPNQRLCGTSSKKVLSNEATTTTSDSP